MRKTHMYLLMIGIVLLGILCPIPQSKSAIEERVPTWSSDFRPYGGYVDEVKFIIYPDEDIPLAILALQKGDIDAYDESVPQDYLAALVNDPNIEVTFTPSVRYRVLKLNCELFPLNITAFRRALAFGYDKYRANLECIGGAGWPQDSYIPITITEWEVESEMSDHFYEADYVLGNRSLKNAGFKDLDGDGWREYDKNNNSVWDPGVDLDDDTYAQSHYTNDMGILDMFVTAGYDPAIKACEIMVDTLAEMGIRSKIIEIDPRALDSYPSDLYLNGEVICQTDGIAFINTPKFLYNNFATGGWLNTDPYNHYHFNNDTISAILEDMVAASDINEVKQYAREASSLLAFEQPQIVVYNDVDINAYRNDRFDGWFEFRGAGVSSGDNWACATKVHLKESHVGPYGGSFYYCLSDNMGTLNPYYQKTGYEDTVFQYIYEKLWNIDPITWDPIPGLAYNWEIEQTSAGGDNQDGQKFTFYLYENETWHDGEPFTAADVNHSIYLWRSSPRSKVEMADIYKVELPEGPEGHIIEIFVNKTGYFKWADTTRFYITPEHIWRDVTNISAFIPTDDQTIGTGPYMWNEHVPGEYISLLRHEDWRWDIR
ncbi:MAG: ABC transporter substrate-binding protein, partial [Promethearchaeota archaeon]